jgi:curved DNA-binding protein
MEFKDYYAELGLPRGASEQSIKQAYRNLARQFHPDVNPDNKDAEERFKAIGEAYTVLSDPKRRKRYDSLYRRYRRWVEYGDPGNLDWAKWQKMANMPSFDFFFTVLDSVIGLEEKHVDTETQRPGDDLEVTITVTLEEVLQGAQRTVRVDRRRIDISIPPGIHHGMEVCRRGHGTPGVLGIPPGDLYVVVQIEPHPIFERKGDDLVVSVPVDIFTSLIGGEVSVPTLDGEDVTVEIPPRTQADSFFCVSGKGLPHMRNTEQRGNLFARVKLVLPEPISESEMKTLRKMAQKRKP